MLVPSTSPISAPIPELGLNPVFWGSSLLNHLTPALFITARDLVTPTLYSQSLTGCWKPEGFKMWSATTYSREAISTNSVQMDLLQTGTGPTPTNFTESLNTSLMHTSI